MRRTHRRVLATAFIAALAVPSAVSAQVCMGVPISDGAFGIFGQYTTTKGVDGFGGDVTANLNGPFSVQLGYRLDALEDIEENANTFYGNVAYEFPNMSFSVCPIAGVSYGTWSDEVLG